MRQPNDDYFICGRKCNPLGSRVIVAFLCAAVSVAVLSTMLGPASAASEVRGRPDDMQLRAENASIREVLDALSADFRVTYRLAPNVSRVVTGLYSGTLNQVLARILDGHDYIVEVSDDGVQIVVLGASGATASAPSGPAIAASPYPVAPKVLASTPTPPLVPTR